MNRERPKTTLSMRCPRCLDDVAAGPDSSGVIAWFTCPACGYDWSTRLRNGRPDIPVEITLAELTSPAGVNP
jgi:hypothetical protein